MSNGYTHTNTTLLAATGIFIVGCYLSAKPPDETKLIYTACITLGCITGILLSPDLDIEKGSISMAHVRNFTGNAGGIFSTLWLWYWWPYAKAIPHRHFLSHFPVVSTIIRMIYLFILPIIILFIMFLQIENGLEIYKTIIFNLYVVFVFLGLCVSDTLHAIMDWLL